MLNHGVYNILKVFFYYFLFIYYVNCLLMLYIYGMFLKRKTIGLVKLPDVWGQQTFTLAGQTGKTNDLQLTVLWYLVMGETCAFLA